MTAVDASAAPLVVTLVLDHQAQERFDLLRQLHFPPERNHLAAHVTLFHHLPGDELDAVQAELVDVARRDPFDLAVTGVRLLGGGVAYDLRAPEVESLHGRLANAWARWLTPQDRQPVRPHVTVQNKVPPAQARELHTRLIAAFVPAVVRAEGLALWRYLGGPWEPVSTATFAA